MKRQAAVVGCERKWKYYEDGTNQIRLPLQIRSPR